MEQAHRSAMAHHDHWSAQMGAWVMINAAWYYPPLTKPPLT
jgi:hypothetical protein